MKVINRSQFKTIAKNLAQETNCKPTHAHEAVAKFLGFKSHNHYLAELKKYDTGKQRRTDT